MARYQSGTCMAAVYGRLPDGSHFDLIGLGKNETEAKNTLMPACTKAKASEEVGIVSRGAHLDADVSEETVLRVLGEFNDDDEVDGILLQLPLPKHIDSDRCIAAIPALRATTSRTTSRW